MLIQLNLWAMAAKAKVQSFLTKENGEVNIVAMVVLIGIAVILALAFKSKIVDLLGKIFEGVDGQVTQINAPVNIP